MVSMRCKTLNHLTKCRLKHGKSAMIGCMYVCLLSVMVTFIDREGQVKQVKGKVGDNILYLAHRHNIELEGVSSSQGVNSGGL